MSPPVLAVDDNRRVTLCPRCGSSALRRSMPRNLWERSVRALTPVHYYLCRDCSFRGVRAGRLSLGEQSAASQLPSRPVEARDRELAQRRVRQMVSSLVLATLLGVASGLYLHSCRQNAELSAPPAE